MAGQAIDLSREEPLYVQVMEEIRKKIVSNHWSQGMMIPSENELIKEFNVSSGTVKKALGELVQEGILFRRQGRGTFVASPDFSKSFSRFFRYGLFQGDKEEIPGSRYLSMQIINAGQDISDTLHLDSGAPVLKMDRVRTLQNLPFSVEEILLPYERFQGLEDMDLKDKLLYPIYNKEFSTPIFWAEEYLQPAVATEDVSVQLDISPQSPVMCVERIAYTYEDIPVEWRRSMGRGDSFRYHIVIR